MRLAIFDFDGTIYKHNTFDILMNHLKHDQHFKHKYPSFLRSVLLQYIGAKLKVYPNEKMRTHSMQTYMATLDRQTKSAVNNYFAEIAEKMRPDFNEKIVTKLNIHNDKNDHLMLVSGAFTPLLNQFKNEFNFDTIIGTNIPFLKNEVNKTEQIDHIQGKRKVEKILRTTHNKSINWQASYAYADSFSDLPVLQLVGHPIAVNPDKKLYEHAKNQQWQIID